MSDAAAVPQPTIGTSPSKADAQSQKQETISVLNKFLEADGVLYGNSVKAILAYAKNVLAARVALKPKSIPLLGFTPWIDFQAKSKGGKGAVSKCIAIAEHPALNDPKNIKYLPASLSSIYELTIMSVEEFNHAAKSGTINPAMTRDDARAIAGKKPHPNRNVKGFGKPANVRLKTSADTNGCVNNERPRTRTTRAEAEEEDHLEAAIALEKARAKAEPKETTINFQLVMSLSDYEANQDEVTHLIDGINITVTTFKARWIPSLRFIKSAA